MTAVSDSESTSEATHSVSSRAPSPSKDNGYEDEIEPTRPSKRRRVSNVEEEEWAIQQLLPSISRINKKNAAIDGIPEPPRPSGNVPAESALTSSTFSSLPISPWLLSSLRALSITRPTAVQRACIPEILKGGDCIGGSRTGSGKTVAFAVPILQKWAEDPTGIFAVVLTPTRELALQIQEQFLAISNPYPLKSLLITGGVDLREQAIALEKRPHVVIATPGRLADHIINSGKDTTIGLRRTKIVVLDEADRLLTVGPGSMLRDVETCLGALPPSAERQTLLFTATITPEVTALESLPRPASRSPIFKFSTLDAKSNIQNAAESEFLNPANSILPPTLTQTYLLTPTTHRAPYLHVLLSTAGISPLSTIIFCNRTNTAAYLSLTLQSLGHSLTSLHSSLHQRTRTSNLALFRSRTARILIATDLASRGLDIPSVDLVINYDLPRNPDDYVHRVGRTARAGRRGTSISLIGQRDVDLVHAIEERVASQMVEWKEEGVNVETRVVRDGGRVVKDIAEAGMAAWRVLEREESRLGKGKKRAAGS